ncbi:hypothetical protein QAD02_011075 [Eretmocerus hayati]|uniref:Uncharacterized protein n=1 Tax=Eretmocerus hayati TaxID=131215 RepID=A0ACC2NYC4_9HYME|nr:hypothetical protein QAD02_011075 [Eretmocerus hayati]
MDSDVTFDTESEDERRVSVNKPYKCHYDGCKAVFSRPSRLEHHVHLHENKRPYKCPNEGCDKSYTSPSHLKRHAQTHQSAVKVYQCEQCSAKMSTLSNLKRHYKRAHNPERELFCQECKLAFRKRSRYEEHIASHKNSSMYECEKCKKTFLTHMKLTKHQLNHAPKNYSCPVEGCPDSFERWALLMLHQKVEHSKSNFICPECDEVFSSQSSLNQHSKIHIDNRPAIPCPYKNCKRLYYFKRNLDQHVRIKHTGHKFCCDLCKVELSTKQKLREHILKIHSSPKESFKRKQQSTRIDQGQAKRSALTLLTGFELNAAAEVKLMQRNPTALLRDKAAEEASFSEDGGGSDISAKGA